MRVAFRVDAAIWIGIGHVMRCLTLAEELHSKGVEVSFVCRGHVGQMGDVIMKRGFEVSILPSQNAERVISNGVTDYSSWLGVTWQRDADETIDAISGNSLDWLITDHYGIDHRWHERVRPYTQKIMAIDDLANRKLDCALLLDQTAGRRRSEYQPLLPQYSHQLLGASYALLRPEFDELRQRALDKRQGTESIQRILIFLGGVDSRGWTLQAIQSVANISWPSLPEVDVVISERSPHYTAVEGWIKESGFPFTLHADVPDMAQLMLDVDLAIGAGGTTSWERCALGLPTLLKVISKNQRQIANTLTEVGAVELWQTQYDLRNKLSGLMWDLDSWRKMSERASKVCDAAGSARVVETIFALG